MIDVNISRTDREANARLLGDLDMNGVLKIEPILDGLLDGADMRRLTIDLRGLQFLDSTGLGMLLTVLERTRAMGIELRVVRAPAAVQRVFEVSGVSLPFVDAAEASS